MVPEPSRRANLQSGDPVEVFVGVLEGCAVLGGARRDEEIGGRHGHPPLPRSPRGLAGPRPDLRGDLQVGHLRLELAKHPLLVVASRPVPELEPHHGTPAGLAFAEEALHPTSRGRVAVRA